MKEKSVKSAILVIRGWGGGGGGWVPRQFLPQSPPWNIREKNKKLIRNP